MNLFDVAAVIWFGIHILRNIFQSDAAFLLFIPSHYMSQFIR
ncbi:hypothetical protein CES85_0025 [Ochrobactrum quorumnocens]|uniref:Uncharacterized protein n=1 Tax=Ochrobactrum quorumnocens TaxID=271865 RepID=A0A248UHU9_9HYPH|nr:hypothetical protein CES85_0025 [[Ochrobactrum] quorumnocens]